MKIKDNQIGMIRVLSFLIATAIIVYFLPRTDEHHYTFEVNKPWSYSLLTAPFDIPIYLDSISAASVRDSIDQAFEPVFKRDQEVEKITIKEYVDSLNASTAISLTATERNSLISTLREIYDNGIVDQRTYAQIASGKLPVVKYVHDNVAVAVPTGNYLSDRLAYAYIDSLYSDPRFHQAITATKLSEALVPNVTYDSIESERMRTELYRKAMAPRGVIQQGERIIDEGDIVTLQLYTVLQTYEDILQEKKGTSDTDHYYPLAGQVLYMVIIFSLLFIYLKLFRPDYYSDSRKLLMIMSLITVFTLLAFFTQAALANGLFLVPLTMVPIMVLIFLDSRTALFVHINLVLIVSLVSTGPLEFIFLQFVAGVIAVESLKELTRRSQLLRAGLLVFIGYCISYVSIRLIQLGSLSKLSPEMFGTFVMNAVMVSFTYVLIFIIEKAFGFTSKVTLVELSDINNPLLRELSEKCPGTFNHSMAVSNLASAAASRIDANVQLVRTGALYHDIGKIDNPAFFTENQHGVNPHDVLAPEQSARIIIDHVNDGLKRAEKAKLPDVIKRFITEHHGKGVARYFYSTYCKQHPDEEVDKSLFTYPGNNPTSKETSLLMMADAVEASSRSLKDHSPEAITELVNRIIDTQIAEGLHNDSPLSFRDIKAIKDSFITRLRTMYHSRVSYPEATKVSTAADSSAAR